MLIMRWTRVKMHVEKSVTHSIEQGPEAIRAIERTGPYDPKRASRVLVPAHAWLDDKELPQAPTQATQHQAVPSGEVPQSLQQKMQQLQALVGQLQQQGVDLQPVGGVMQGFQPLMEQRKFSEAEALVDRALKMAGELAAPGAPQTGPPTAMLESSSLLYPGSTEGRS
jgi:hypothetical protein